MNTSINKRIFFLKERKAQYILSILLFVLLFGFGYFHATKGIDLTDEGMYLSASMRYALGDIPFRDEIMNVVRPFDVLVAPVFMVFPDISLLQMRSLGLLLHIMSLLLLFLLLRRYAPPFLVALICAIMFLLNNFYGILTPSYNSLSSDFSIISLTFWLFAIASDRKSYRFLFSILGGFFFSLVALSYSSLILIICIPLALIIISLYSFEKRKTYFWSSMIFVGTFGIIMSIAAIIVASFGLLPDFIQGFLETASATQLGTQGPFVKIHSLFIKYLDVAPKGLILLGVLAFALYIVIVPGKRGKSNFIYGIIAIIAILSVFSILLAKQVNLVLLSFAVPLALLILFLNYEDDSKSTVDISWNRVRNIAITWGFISALVYGISHSGGLHASLLGATPLFVVGLIALYRIVYNYATLRRAGTIRSAMWRAVLVTMMVVFLIASLKYNYKCVYRDLDMDRLTARFDHPKIRGIYSTPEKVRVLEELLSYLNEKVKPKDYFLAYNYIPMLYFLTHTRPAYGAVWARDDWPISLREGLLEKMIDNDRIPEYCVRMLTRPAGDWKTPMIYDEKAPLDLYVNSNYYLEEIIYPFEIWRRGNGPKLRIFNQKIPDFSTLFFKWEGEQDVVNLKELSQNSAPLMNLGNRGKFNFRWMREGKSDVIRVTSVGISQNGEREIQFGYTLRKNGFNLKLNPGQDVVFIISARLSEKPVKPVTLFIQDKTDRWEKNRVIINKTTWEQYIVSKRIREDASVVNFGIYWEPDTDKQWLEIKNVRIFVDYIGL